MKNVIILFGNFTFIDETESKTGKQYCIINSVEKSLAVDTEKEDIEEVGENGLADYDGYLIPSMYQGDILNSYPSSMMLEDGNVQDNVLKAIELLKKSEVDGETFEFVVKQLSFVEYLTHAYRPNPENTTL